MAGWPSACRPTRWSSCSSCWPRSACPAPSGFVGEVLVIVGVFQVNSWVALFAATGMILGAAYMLWLYRRVIFGALTKDDLKPIKDLRPNEIVGLRAAAAAGLR